MKTLYSRIGLGLSLGLLLWTAALPSSARAAEPRRLGITVFRGPGEGVTRNVVSQAGKSNNFQVVGGQQISKAASKLGVTLDTNDGFKAVAKELGIAAFVTGEVTTKKATLTVRNGSDGSVSAEATWSGPNPKKLASVVEKTFWRRLGSAIERGKAPGGSKQVAVADEAPAPETSAAGGGDDEDDAKAKHKSKSKKAVAEDSESGGGDVAAESKSKKKKSKKKASSDDEAGEETTVSAKAEREDEGEGGRPDGLDLAVGLRAMTRSLSYTQDINPGRNAKYTLPLAPLVAFSGDIYPGALLGGQGMAANVGLTAEVSYLLPVVSTPPPSGPGSYGTYSLSWAVGAKVRLPFGLFAGLSYGDQRYQLTPSGGATGIEVPMTEYRFVRVGAGIKHAFTPEWSIAGNAAYLQCLSLGQIGGPGYYPKGTGAAFEAGVAFGYRVSSLLEVRAGGDIRRYGLSFHVTPAAVAADPTIRVAGGAVDQYLTGWVALAVLMGGDSSGGGGGSGKASGGDDDEDAAATKPSKSKHDDDDDGGKASDKGEEKE